MKNTFISILSLLWLIGCQSDSESISAEIGRTFQLEVGKETRITGQSDSLKIVVQSISDGRCPQGVECVRAGNAQVQLTISEGSDAQMVDLCIGDCHLDFDKYAGFVEQDTTLATIATQTYSVILKDVLPYPAVGKSSDEKEAVLEVSLQ